MDLKEIISTWVTSFSASDSQKKLAEERLKICESCPSIKKVLKKKSWSFICGECGCPVAKKVFTNRYNPCPLQKWENVDVKYFDLKHKKTII